jgi:hypothetical protein
MGQESAIPAVRIDPALRSVPLDLHEPVTETRVMAGVVLILRAAREPIPKCGA